MKVILTRDEVSKILDDYVRYMVRLPYQIQVKTDLKIPETVEFNIVKILAGARP